MLSQRYLTVERALTAAIVHLVPAAAAFVYQRHPTAERAEGEIGLPAAFVYLVSAPATSVYQRHPKAERALTTTNAHLMPAATAAVQAQHAIIVA